MICRRTAMSRGEATSNVLAVPRPIAGTCRRPSWRNSIRRLPPILHLPRSQHADDLPRQALGLNLDLPIAQRRERMRHIEHRIVRHTPYSGCRLRGGPEMIGANGGGRNAGAIEMDAIVHTARAARASIAHADEHQVTRLGELVDHRGSRWL